VKNISRLLLLAALLVTSALLFQNCTQRWSNTQLASQSQPRFKVLLATNQIQSLEAAEIVGRPNWLTDQRLNQTFVSPQSSELKNYEYSFSRFNPPSNENCVAQGIWAELDGIFVANMNDLSRILVPREPLPTREFFGDPSWPHYRAYPNTMTTNGWNCLVRALSDNGEKVVITEDLYADIMGYVGSPDVALIIGEQPAYFKIQEAIRRAPDFAGLYNEIYPEQIVKVLKNDLQSLELSDFATYTDRAPTLFLLPSLNANGVSFGPLDQMTRAFPRVRIPLLNFVRDWTPASKGHEAGQRALHHAYSGGLVFESPILLKWLQNSQIIEGLKECLRSTRERPYRRCTLLLTPYVATEKWAGDDNTLRDQYGATFDYLTDFQQIILALDQENLLIEPNFYLVLAGYGTSRSAGFTQSTGRSHNIDNLLVHQPTNSIESALIWLRSQYPR
jgi:hypothetical protein